MGGHGLRFSVLGPLLVLRDGESVELGGPKQRGVLAVLLINANRPVSSDRIIDEVWGDMPPETATATLQAYISNLRRALEPDRPPRSSPRVLQKNGGGYQLVIDGDALDAARFESLVGRAAGIVDGDVSTARRLLIEALGLWRGPALADFTYAAFAQSEISRLEEIRIGAIELKIGADLALGRAEELIPELEALVSEHPLRERMWAHLMLALYRSGRQAEALRAYRRFEEALGEVGIVPGADLRALEMAILSQDPALRPAHEGTSPTGAAVEEAPALVGRTPQIDRFRLAVNHALRGVGTVLLFQGEAGIGKTRLLEVLAEEARARGFRTGFARCVEVGGTPPFWPWMQLVRQLGITEVADAAGPLGGSLAPLFGQDPTQALTAGPPLFRVAEAVIASLRTLAAEAPIVVVIDDLYSADPDSLSLLTLVATELEEAPVVILASHRGEAVDPAHPLIRTLGELLRLSWVDRIQLPRFDLDEVAELVSRLAGADVDEATVRAINDRTDGNALFTLELTKLLQAERALEPEKAATAVPATIREVISRRLGQLSEDALRVVRTGAVSGREFDLSVVAETLEFDGERSLEAIDEVLGSQLLTETTTPGVYRFSHMIVADSVSQPLGAMRRAHIHGLISVALERRFGSDETRWIEIAHHRKGAIPLSGPLPAIVALARAGQHAMHSTALELAESLFGQRHDLVVGHPATPDRNRLEVESWIDLCRVWTWREGYHSRRLQAASVRLWELTGIAGNAVEFEPGREITSSDPVLCALMSRFSFEIVAGDVPASREVASRCLQLSTRYPDHLVRFVAHHMASIADFHAGRVAEGVLEAQQAEASLEVLDPTHQAMLMLPLGQQAARVSHHAFSGWGYWLAGEHDRAFAELTQARLVSDRLEQPFTKGFCVTVTSLVGAMDQSPHRVLEALAWGRTSHDEGLFGLIDLWHRLLLTWAEGMLGNDPARAADEMRQILEVLQAEGALVVHSLYWGMVAGLEFEAGRPILALEASQRGLDYAHGSGERFWIPELERLAADAHAALGRPAESAAARARAERAARDMGAPGLLARLAAGVPTV